MKRIRSEIRRRWTLLRYTVGLPAALDRRIAKRAAAKTMGGASRTAHLLIAAPGDGNIGDQALFEAFLENAPGPVVAIVREVDDIDIPQALADRVSIVPLPDLVYGEGAPHVRAVERFVELLAQSRSLSIIGADIMDGRYSLRGSVRRATLAEIGARAGRDTRIIGFSWNASPRLGARRALARASRAGVRACLRDPRSAERALHDGIRNVTAVADIVFAATLADSAPIRPPSPYAIVNVSGLIARGVDQTGQYRRIVDHLRGAGIHVVIVPHVIKDLSDDLIACARLAEACGPQDLTLVESLMSPAQIRDLASRAVVTVTGRMHLAIMSLMGHTPAVTLATQGKVEGLMEFFGTPQLCVPPEGAFAENVIATLDDVIPASSAVRVAIERALPRVQALARSNTDGLGGPGATTSAGRRQSEGVH